MEVGFGAGGKGGTGRGVQGEGYVEAQKEEGGGSRASRYQFEQQKAQAQTEQG